ncbi:NapC/NirT family cytochrome c [Shewanella intestini]|uniref:Cytochrome c-type protein n=1 Tax=Shewanella intestini TaxID=2017544 RepID=A0ABS5I5A8_9GAMM|nr:MULTISPECIES: NapC/NirT family cytochrome c [Shewanella]MBR9728495.1 cytochrome C [Shewanella intestini]MRG36314.1 cytochrome C [Shewanella sp. XMDDZSB0408]
MEKIKQVVITVWQVIKKPSVHFSLGFLVIGGFAGGVIFWGAFNTALDMSSTEEFCSSCHQNVYSELQSTIHYTNRSGVRATCHDCHVPHRWTDKIARKMQASKEIWAHLVGTIDTPEKFEARRGTLAAHEWRRLKANDSLECRNCHEYGSMDFTRQSLRGANMHKIYLESDEKTCIDCHKGIAHKLPDMASVEGF